MIIKKTVSSWDAKDNKDCFGFKGSKVIDHIYPISRGGSMTSKINQQFLSNKANMLKADKTKGKIGKVWSFSILLQKNKSEEIYGKMYIRNKNWAHDVWYEVLPIINLK